MSEDPENETYFRQPFYDYDHYKEMFKSKLQTEKCAEKVISEKEMPENGRETRDQTMPGSICSLGFMASKPQNIQGIETNSPVTSTGSSFVFVQEEDIVP